MPKNLVHLKPAEYVRNIFTVAPPVGTTVEDLLSERFWEHVAKKLQISDRLEVIPEDSAYFAELIVVGVEQNRVRVVLLRGVELDTSPLPVEKITPKYEYKYRGQNLKHCIMHTSDGAPLKEGFNSKKEALLWLENYEIGAVN